LVDSPDELVVKEKYISQVFSNIEEIYKVNTEFLKGKKKKSFVDGPCSALENRLELWNEVSQTLGDLFLSFLPSFEVYTEVAELRTT
jgi:hypothetical protein